MGQDLQVKSAGLISMLSSEWQNALHSESDEVDPEDAKFRWSGKFESNPKVQGSWTAVTDVESIGDFDPDLKKMPKPRKPPFSTRLNLNPDGKTKSTLWIWSGDMLMDISKYQAMKMIVKNVKGTDYLFIEAGNFSNRNKPGWKCKWVVFKKN